MNSKVVEISVGIFVAAGIAALFMLAMKVSNLSAFGEEKGYHVVARFDNIGGLKVRAPVRVGGVRIGHVTKIGYDDRTYEAVVSMVLQSEYNRLPRDTSASIYTAGLLGEQYIGLEPGSAQEYMVEGDKIRHTQSALVLEQLIGQFLFSKASEGGSK